MGKLFGYAGKALRVDLASGTMHDEVLDGDTLDGAVGGTGLGLNYLYNEVAPPLRWSDPANRLVIASGPFGGTNVSGSGTVSVVTKGAMTNMATATQANGFLGAFMKFCGYDAIIIEGAASDWVYLHIGSDGAQLRDARFLVGRDTWEIADAVAEANGDSKHSVFGIGPAGENLVRFAAIAGDRGHVAAHNGVGAVMGSKKLKAIAVARGKRQVPVFDRVKVSEIGNRALARAIDDGMVGVIYRLGTAGLLSAMHGGGMLPVKNYTTSIFPEHERVNGQYTRAHFKNKKAPCWACQFCCTRMTTVTEGPYAGYLGEEPEYEGYAVCSSLIGVTDPGAMVMLANLIDRLGFDMNESGWVMGLAIECYEKGLLNSADTGGLELRWGNVDAVASLLRRIAHREGIGELFADGVRAAAERLGGEALNMAVYTLKGNSPRGHDHRAKWDEMLDTCVGNTGTIECAPSTINVRGLGATPPSDKFSWEEVSAYNAKINGWRQWTDCLGVCNFNFVEPSHQMEAFNAVTGRQLAVEDGLRLGKRIVNQMRMYNIRCGLTPALEQPSRRYGSVPVDGPAAGKGIGEHWADMLRNYYRQMGWDEATGRPTAATLTQLGLEHLLPDLATVD